ncbi:hypothetical protein P676_0642 [Acinetobacter baumannii UH7607]|uniref:Uncharacterized protein n=1 Tax=Acinetobacter baumannii 625974 TaxID=1310607 RepID=A0A009QIF3_ACIBA|nr:hypothetical protein ACIN5180_3955 [Acinetobacter baumannii OIFC180]ELW89134.1 hypothetical protein ACINWCA92_3772 [Acinetobacter baumannii WC-A-92]ELW95474.1 hypothetical protein ACIN5047_3531 [Acinetobacter baumannii OIFC047]ETP83509.1 hypothetical protein P641_0119 [Acinetobacter baumannii UH0807]ETP83970.1 hypothetical protein P642_1053 [Acinetobacter baumannii UH1007]ETP96569.1 hypothetical protein P645_1121 [Acinetobacter baumannii UH10707]ETQ14143.1 hypothetical protein P648_1273 [A
MVEMYIKQSFCDAKNTASFLKTSVLQCYNLILLDLYSR